MQQTRDFLKNINISGFIVVGCSAGPDSMCLLHLLYNEGYKIVCAHINHNIRKESDDEQKYLIKFCKTKNIPIEFLKLPSQQQNEAYYRKKRYDFYKATADKYSTNIIMTAHHGDDLIETILMRLSRGSNLKGYIGFKKEYLENNYKFIKPLIFYTKNEIISYNEDNDIKYYLDKTNEENTYTRNRYRHNILPFLKKENPNIHKKFLQFSEELENVSTYIDNIVKSTQENVFNNNILNVSTFNTQDEFIQKKILERYFSQIYKNDVDKIKVFHIQKIINLLNQKENFTVNLPLGFLGTREYNCFSIEKPLKKESYKIELKTKTILPNGDEIEIIEDSSDTSNQTTRLNTKDLKMPLYIRTRKPGDNMQIKNMLGTKKLKSIFIDSKIDPSKRDTYPILVDREDNILWLPNLRKSKFDNDFDKKYDIILKYTKKGEKIDEKK